MPQDARRADAPFDSPLPRFEQCLAAAAFAAIVIVWFLAFHLEPDPSGIGTHEQLGLATCHMIRWFDIPCPFCGMTTTFAWIAHGEPLRGFLNQPAGALLGFATIPVALATLNIAVTRRLRRWHSRLLNNLRLWAAGATVLLLSWLYKIVIHSIF